MLRTICHRPSSKRRKASAIIPRPSSALGRSIRTKQPAHIADLQRRDRTPNATRNSRGHRASRCSHRRWRSIAQKGRTHRHHPIYRQEVRPFTEKQVELSKTSRPRPSSPSRTHGCSMNCANLSSSRPRPPTYSRSSAVRLASWSQYSRPCWRTGPDYARRSSAPCGFAREKVPLWRPA